MFHDHNLEEMCYFSEINHTLYQFIELSLWTKIYNTDPTKAGRHKVCLLVSYLLA